MILYTYLMKTYDKLFYSGSSLIIGILIGLMFFLNYFSLDGIINAHLFGVHASYMRGCVENSDKPWKECVEKAQINTNDVKEILEKEPKRVFYGK